MIALATCAVLLVLERAQLVNVPYLNDSAVHEEMVRFALERIRHGHLPLTSWFPFLNLGSPQYLHYQALPSILTALIAWPLGVTTAFRFTTWLLLGCWPLCIYCAARVFSMSRTSAVSAAVLSPFISSFTRVGYEQISYLWIGYGVWTQLFAMWTLPFAWAFSWRAVDEDRFVVPAAVAVAATVAFHFETGYLAVGGLMLFVVLRPSQIGRRLWRGLKVAAGAGGLSAWAVVPLVSQGKWAAINEFLQSGKEGVDANSYGAPRVLLALVKGDIFDWDHLVLLTPLVLLGLVACLARWKRTDAARPAGDSGRALAGLFLLSLLLFFGRTTWGPLMNVLPGSRDLFLRRFIVGVQLAGLFMAGVAVAELARLLASFARTLRVRRASLRRTAECGLVVVTLALVLGLILPAWSFVNSEARANAGYVARQQRASRSAGQLDVLIGFIRTHGGGRTFAGDPSDFGANFDVGAVPVYKYLASKDVDEVGFTLRTASLMSDSEVYFDEDDVADYGAFGVRWLLLPVGMIPPVPAKPIEQRGAYALWELPANGYLEVVDTRGSIEANSDDLGSFAASFLETLPPRGAVFPTVAYDGETAPTGTATFSGRPPGSPGSILWQRDEPAEGRFEARVRLDRPAVLLLSSSYDPGWHALVDGRPDPTEMIAPGLLGVRLTRGAHNVLVVYRGFPDYSQLFGLGIIGGLVLALGELARRGHRRRPTRL